MDKVSAQQVCALAEEILSAPAVDVVVGPGQG